MGIAYVLLMMALNKWMPRVCEMEGPREFQDA